jgi:biotin carboxyl carrier protein
MRYVVSVRGREIGVELTPLGGGRLLAKIDGSSEPPFEVTLESDGPDVVATIGSRVLELFSSGNDLALRSRRAIRVEGRERSGRAPGAAKRGASGTVRAPMPGRVVKVLVELGATVEKGVGVVVVEAMKMENELSAPVPGVVERVFVSAGDAVERGAPLVEIR